MSKYTAEQRMAGPWAFFATEYDSYLATNHSGRQIVLSAHESHLMVNIDGVLEKVYDHPEHPVLKLIEAAPEMHRTLKALEAQAKDAPGQSNGDIVLPTEMFDLIIQTLEGIES